jgi:predicted nucleotidyltransferase
MGNGLTDRDIKTIQGIFRKHPEVSMVYLFGSRAAGTQKPGSDVDLAIMNAGVSMETVCMIKGELEESSLPYLIDLVNYTDVKHKEFREHIQNIGIEFFKKGD